MKTKRTYNSGDARYAIDMLIKAYRRKELNDSRTADYLEVIWLFSNKSRLWPIVNRVQAVVDILMGNPSTPDALWKSFLFMKFQIEAIHKKNRIMDVRESSARRKFFEGQREQTTQVIPDQLNVYDIVKVPTQGGFHYSIVAEVKDDYVSCFPTTTASRRDLENMGCRSLSLTASGLERFQGIRLTSSRVKIPIEIARQSYRGSVADNDFIKAILAKMMTIANPAV